MRRFLLGGVWAGAFAGLLAAAGQGVVSGYWSAGFHRLLLAELLHQALRGLVLGGSASVIGLLAARHDATRRLGERLTGASLVRPRLVWCLLVFAAACLLARPLQRFRPRDDGPLTIGAAFLLVAASAILGSRWSRARRARSWQRALALLPIAGIAGLALSAARSPRGSGRPIILITADTLRADHLSLLGYARPTSPYLERRAMAGHVFGRCYSHAPVTCSSIASVITGRRPGQHGTFSNDPLHPREHTLAEYLREAGYATAAVVSNYVLLASKGFADGFQDYDHDLSEGELNRDLPERTAYATTDAALRWLDGRKTNRFFLWIHYQDAHGPYTPPERYRGIFPVDRSPEQKLPIGSDSGDLDAIPSYQVLGSHREPSYYVAQYDGEIRYLDDALEELFSGLEDRGLREDSLILLTADHGEGMGENGYYFAHGHNLFPSVLHVPLIVWHPDYPEGLRHDRLVQHLDVAPTILQFAGVAPARPLAGRPLFAPGSADETAFSEAVTRERGYMLSVTGPSLHIAYETKTGHVTAFDPESSAPVTAPEELRSRGIERLKPRLLSLARQERSLPRWGRPSDSDLERLRSLGYVQ